MPRLDDNVTQMARRAGELDSEFDGAVHAVSGADIMSIEQMAQSFLGMTFKQRATLFTEVLASEGSDGLDKLHKVFRKATALYQEAGVSR